MPLRRTATECVFAGAALLLLACSSPEHGHDAPTPPEQPAASPATAEQATPPAPSDDEPEASDPPPAEPAPPADCVTSFDCTIVRDSCDRPYAVPLDRTAVPPPPSPCPPATYALVEPLCLDGACEAERVTPSEPRQCRRDADCVVAPAPCHDWLVANRRGVAEVRRAWEADLQEIGCPVGSNADSIPRPRAACVADACIPRAGG